MMPSRLQLPQTSGIAPLASWPHDTQPPNSSYYDSNHNSQQSRTTTHVSDSQPSQDVPMTQLPTLSQAVEERLNRISEIDSQLTEMGYIVEPFAYPVAAPEEHFYFPPGHMPVEDYERIELALRTKYQGLDALLRETVASSTNNEHTRKTMVIQLNPEWNCGDYVTGTVELHHRATDAVRDYMKFVRRNRPVHAAEFRRRVNDLCSEMLAILNVQAKTDVQVILMRSQTQW